MSVRKFAIFKCAKKYIFFGKDVPLSRQLIRHWEECILTILTDWRARARYFNLFEHRSQFDTFRQALVLGIRKYRIKSIDYLSNYFFWFCQFYDFYFSHFIWMSFKNWNLKARNWKYEILKIADLKREGDYIKKFLHF